MDRTNDDMVELSSRDWVLRWCEIQEANLGGQANVCDEIRTAIEELETENAALKNTLQFLGVQWPCPHNGSTSTMFGATQCLLCGCVLPEEADALEVDRE